MSLALLAAAAMVAPEAPPALRWAVTGAVTLIALASAGFEGARVDAARRIAVFIAVLAIAMATGVLWQLAMAAALLSNAALTKLFPSIAPSKDWRSRGALPWAGIAMVAGVTPVALVGWVLAMEPDLGDVVATYGLDAFPLPLLLGGAAVFAVVNALLEELIWRGLLQSQLTVLFGATAAIVFQGASFGLQHWHGVPRGPVGAVLAGSWGVMLGVLRMRSRGLLAPLIAHIVADTVIAIILFVLYRHQFQP